MKKDNHCFTSLKCFIALIFYITIISFIDPVKISAEVLFYDNFENSSASNWDHSDNWDIQQIENSLRFGTTINTKSTTRESYAGDINWTNYIYEVDMLALEGEDKNLIFRVIDDKTKYGLHMRSDLAVLEIYDPERGYFEKFNREVSFVNNVTYHLKIVLNGENIKIYSNNSLLFDYTDEGTNITYGKIGLRVTTGAAYPSSVWFDNIIVRTLEEHSVTPTPTSSPPVIFIPGLGASINFKEMFLDEPDELGWRLTPGVNIYNNVFNTFKENNVEHYLFYYDWRASITDSAKKLNDFIGDKISDESEKVNLVGHSLGGLIARACIQQQNGCHAQKLITAGSPHFGVVDVYPAVEAGEIWRKGIVKLALELMTHYYWKPGETRRETLERKAPVLKELLPVFDFISKDGSLISWDNLNIKNTLLPSLSDISSLNDLTTTIYGKGHMTPEGLIVDNPNWLDEMSGNWPDGKPTGVIESKSGDGTVLSSSASLVYPGIDIFDFELDHGSIISNETVLEKIFTLLGYEVPVDSSEKQVDANNFLIFLARSPIAISSTETHVENHLSDKLIVIPNPHNKVYSLEVVGKENGNYLLSVGQIFENQVFWNDFPGLIKKGEVEVFSFLIDPQKPSNNILTNVEENRLFLKHAIEEFKMEIEKENVKKPFKNRLLSLLDKIFSDNKKIEKSFVYLNLLRKSIAICEKNNYLTREFANIARLKSSRIATLLESLFSLDTRKISKKKTVNAIESATIIKKEIEENKKLNQYSLETFLEGQEKLNKATENFKKAEYSMAYILALEAKNLFLETRLIK